MPVYVLPKSTRFTGRWDGLPVFDVTTGGGPFRPLSPMLLGPAELYGGLCSRNVENAWQYAKVYPQHQQGGYWPWAMAGWGNPRAVRYPMGKGARPLHSLWAGSQLGYIEARKRIYLPLYAHAVRFRQLRLLWELEQAFLASGSIALLDFDAYDHRSLGYTWDDVLNDPGRKMGHAFVLAMMIEGTA